MSTPTPYLRDVILTECFERYTGIFAGGEEANNKLDLEKIQHHPELRQRVVGALGRIVNLYGPDAVLPVPNGAIWLGEDLAEQHGLACIHLRKDAATGAMDFLTKEEEKRCMDMRRLFIVEDAFTRFTNTWRVLRTNFVARRAVVAAAIWDRGVVTEREQPFIPTHSLLTEHIPAQLPPDSPLWEYADG